MQSYGLSDFLQRVAEKIDALNEGKINYAEMLRDIEGVLGYELEDKDLQERLKNEARSAG